MNIRKISLLLIANLVGLGLMAEGYQLNTQSARQIGMGHTGTALKLGSESMVFNPAGLSFMKGVADLSFGATGVISKVTFKSGSYKMESDNPMGTPIFGYVGYKIIDNFYAGVSITNPAGNSLVWSDNWKGSHLVQDISLKAFAVQPTLSYKIGDKLSIGAGLMVNFGSFELNKGLLPVGGLAGYLQVPGFPEPLKQIITNTIGISPLNANLQGNSKVTFGYNIGLLFSPTEELSIGLSYRSKVNMKLEEGVATVSAGSTELASLLQSLTTPGSPLFNASLAGAMALNGMKFSSQLPIPSTLNLGVAYNPTSRLLLTADINYVGWKAYDKLIMKFANSAFDTEQIKDFKNSFTYRVGAEYKLCERMEVRGGFIYDATPVNKSYYSPETPGANKPSFTAGFSYSPLTYLSIDVALQYLNGIKIHGSMPQNAPLQAFEGDYKSTAFLPSLGVRFNF